MRYKVLFLISIVFLLPSILVEGADKTEDTKAAAKTKSLFQSVKQQENAMAEHFRTLFFAALDRGETVVVTDQQLRFLEGHVGLEGSLTDKSATILPGKSDLETALQSMVDQLSHPTSQAQLNAYLAKLTHQQKLDLLFSDEPIDLATGKKDADCRRICEQVCACLEERFCEWVCSKDVKAKGICKRVCRKRFRQKCKNVWTRICD